MTVLWAIVTLLLGAFLLLTAAWLGMLLYLAVRSVGKSPPPPEPAVWPRFLLVVPAHNEEALIANTVARILAFDYPKELFSLHVVADNCTDRTAAIAREAGANCLERTDAEHRGKGHALDFALKELANVPADAVLFLDADSYPEPDYLRAMGRHVAAGKSVVQGRYEARSLRDTWFARLTAMSFLLRNRWVFPGLDRLGWSLPLRGSGMCFAASVIRASGWNAHGLTEDLEMTRDILRRGDRVAYAPEAVSGQYMPSEPRDAATQRRRWSAGERSVRRVLLMQDLPEAIRAKRWSAAFLCVYLSAPSMSAQLLGLAAATVLTLIFAPWLSAFALLLLVLYALYFALGLPKFDRLSLKAWCMIPVYAVWRVWWALRAQTGGKPGAAEWVRADRPEAAAGTAANAGQGTKTGEKPLRVLILGTRGVPANYGGFETCVDEVGTRLAARGYDVTVYCRKSSYPPERRVPVCKGMRCVYLPALRRQSLETLSHTAFSVLHALFRPADFILACNVANSPVLFPLRLKRAPLVLHTDGLEWKRGEYTPLRQKYFKMGERIGTWVATRILTDAHAMGDYYRDEYRTDSTTIPHGACCENSVRPELLDSLGLKPKEYFLQVTRFEPGNNPLMTARAFLDLETDKKLVLVGGASYEGKYQRDLKALAGGRVLQPGFIYDQDLLRELWCNCHAYIHGNEVGGTNPALLQAMAHGCFVIARDVVFNREVLGDAGLFFIPEKASLVTAMRWTLENEALLDGKRRDAREIIRRRYDWDDIADQYETLIHSLA